MLHSQKKKNKNVVSIGSILGNKYLLMVSVMHHRRRIIRQNDSNKAGHARVRLGAVRSEINRSAFLAGKMKEEPDRER